MRVFIGVTFLVLLVLLAAAALATEWPTREDRQAIGLLDSLQVAPIHLDLDMDPQVASKQLWDRFANGELAKIYATLPLPGNQSAWPIFKSKLLNTAKAQGLETSSLENALNKIERKETWLTSKGQLIPFGAFIAHQGHKKVWVIPCGWEYGYSSQHDGPVQVVKPSHIRIWAYLMGSGQEVAYVTCK